MERPYAKKSPRNVGDPNFIPWLDQFVASVNKYAADAAATGFVPATRTLTAGTGLTGGGTLAANRTFAVTGNLATLYGLANSAGMLWNNGAGVLSWNLAPSGLTGLTMASGQIQGASGTQTAPGLSFASYTNSGFWPNSATNLNLSLNGTLYYSFNSAGFILRNNSPILDSNLNEFLKFTSAASAVNEITISNAATGNAPSWAVTGGDANIDAAFSTKGSGVFKFTGKILVNDRLHIGTTTLSAAARLRITSNDGSSLAWGTSGCIIRADAMTFTDGASSGVVAASVANGLGVTTFAASNVTTYTDAATLYIAGAPAAGTNVTLTNSYALWVDAGRCRFDDEIVTNNGLTNWGTTIWGRLGTATSTATQKSSNIFRLQTGMWNGAAAVSHGHEIQAIASTSVNRESRLAFKMVNTSDVLTEFMSLSNAGALTLSGSATLGAASTDVITHTGRMVVRSVTDAGPMTATSGTVAEIVYNTSDSKFYGCTATGTPATWAALN